MASAGLGGFVNLWNCWIIATHRMTTIIFPLGEGESLWEWPLGTWISSSIWENVWSPWWSLTLADSLGNFFYVAIQYFSWDHDHPVLAWQTIYFHLGGLSGPTIEVTDSNQNGSRCILYYLVLEGTYHFVVVVVFYWFHRPTLEPSGRELWEDVTTRRHSLWGCLRHWLPHVMWDGGWGTSQMLLRSSQGTSCQRRNGCSFWIPRTTSIIITSFFHYSKEEWKKATN